MAQAARAWNFAPTDTNRLGELMKSFGCADVIAPVDLDAFGRRAGELIRRGVSGPSSRGREEKRPVQGGEIGSAPELSLLDVIHHAPWSDRLTLLVAAAASTSLLIAAGAVLLGS
jgi:hypothetical protein